ncbi:hypothetical protein [Maridesulfovibrio hydrothermalis]|nr:hypothetical protein [Maridesulfovibrio hydrothermalis]
MTQYLNKKEFLDEVKKWLPVFWPWPGQCYCPLCIGWMQYMGTKKVGRPDCPLCEGFAVVPYEKVAPESIAPGRDLKIVHPDDGYTYLAPYFGECNNPGRFKALKLAGKMRCLGCQEMCFVPDSVKSGEWIITDPRYKKYKSLAPKRR